MIVITGKSCAGKDCIAKELIRLGATRIITYTTREMRPGEVNGVHYHFIPEEKFKDLISQDFFAEYKKYKVSNGDTWYYGSAKKDYIGNKFIILTPAGLDDIRKLDLDITSFYIEVADDEILARLKIRGDDESEAHRRFLADKKDFDDIYNKVDFVISNDGKHSLSTLAEVILSATRGRNSKMEEIK